MLRRLIANVFYGGALDGITRALADVGVIEPDPAVPAVEQLRAALAAAAPPRAQAITAPPPADPDAEAPEPAPPKKARQRAA